MAKITLNISPDVIKAFEKTFNYAENKKLNETKSQFAKRMIIKHVKIILFSYRNSAEKQIVSDNIKNEVDAIDMN